MDDATSDIYSAFLDRNRRRHGVDVLGAAGGVWATWPAAEPVHGSRQSLLSHFRGRRPGGSRPADPDQARAGTSGRRAYRGVFAFPRRAAVPERLFHTLQDRLPKELALTGITTMAEANAWQCARDIYSGPQRAGSRQRPSRKAARLSRWPGLNLAEVLCVEEERVVVVMTTAYHSSIAEATDTGKPVASALRQGDWRKCINIQTAASLLPWPPLPRTLRQQRRPGRRTSCAEPAEQGCRPVPPSGSRRVTQGCQGRFAPRCGDLACGKVIPDSPSARRALARQVGSGKWSRQSHQEMADGDTAPPKHKTPTSGHMMCHIDRPT